MTTSSRAVRLLALLIVVLAALLFAAGCGSDDEGSGGGSGADESAEVEGGGGGDEAADEQLDKKVAARADSYTKSPGAKLDPAKPYTVRVETTKGSFDITIDPKVGPIAAANFVGLVKDGFYDGVKFHRIIEDFMVQTGDPLGTGTGGPGYAIKDDPVKGSYKRGVVAMANAGPNTGGSQFFIVQGSDVQLPPDYAIFGMVDAAGMKVVDKIAAVDVEAGPNGEVSSPTETVRITSAKLLGA